MHIDEKMWNKIDINLNSMAKLILEIGFGHNLWQFFQCVKEYTSEILEKLKSEMDRINHKHFGAFTINTIYANEVVKFENAGANLGTANKSKLI